MHRSASPATLAAAVALLLLTGCRGGGSAECNPFFPVPAGASWGYREARRSAPVQMLRRVTVESVRTEAGVTTATLRQTVSAADQPARAAGSGTTTVRCTAGAVEVATDGSTAAAPDGGPAAGTVRADLPGLPSADRLVPGYVWQSKGRIEAAEGPTTVVSTFARSSKVEGMFPIKVAAGEFPQALRVAISDTITLSTVAGERQTRQELREWYVRGVGLVRRETRLGDAEGPVASNEELVEYDGVAPIS